MSQQEDIAVTKFREYLRVNTEQPNPDYEGCAKFLCGLATELGIECQTIRSEEYMPFVLMSIPGAQPELPALLLYSHTDVVPTFKDHWTHDPYSAFKDESGNIFARGAQDMKCVGSQYIEAIRRHFGRGKKQWKRTIHLLFGPDEEIGGDKGMRSFALTEEFRKLNIGFALDEGLASENDTYKVFYGERVPWWLKVTCGGNPGHGSKFIENTAAEKMQKVINSALAFREEQRQLLTNHSDWTLGDVTTLNLNQAHGGVQINVVPEKYELYFDIRVTPKMDFNEMQSRIEKWCTDAGPDVKFEFIQSNGPNSLDIYFEKLPDVVSLLMFFILCFQKEVPYFLHI
ncbi:hypothetical protein WR25_09792 isoform D [Diploscapter pachys]|uniref:N-acyl-aliphatic-L-amino acid amidohydrolase n=1 Tax=Diploscapter pachys TaxID=2018661 RepID=A0A2A2KG42_9BILA|nr:hypothetical protein WR25_09792 isoform D [Diploscapter pachys]